MSFVIDKITYYYQKVPGLAALFNTAPPDKSDAVAHQALTSDAHLEPHPHDIHPLKQEESSTAATVKASLMATGLATLAVLGGWKIALGGYIIYQGTRWVRGKRKDGAALGNDEDLDAALQERSQPEDSLHRPLSEVLAAEPDVHGRHEDLHDIAAMLKSHDLIDTPLPKLMPENSPAAPALPSLPPLPQTAKKEDGSALPSLPPLPSAKADGPATPSALPPLPRAKAEGPASLTSLPKGQAEVPASPAAPVPGRIERSKPVARAATAPVRRGPAITRTQTEARRDANPTLTFTSAIANGWQKDPLAHSKVFNVIAIGIFWPLQKLLAKMTNMKDGTRYATKIAKGISGFLTVVTVFPWLISLVQLAFKKKKKDE